MLAQSGRGVVCKIMGMDALWVCPPVEVGSIIEHSSRHDYFSVDMDRHGAGPVLGFPLIMCAIRGANEKEHINS